MSEWIKCPKCGGKEEGYQVSACSTCAGHGSIPVKDKTMKTKPLTPKEIMGSLDTIIPEVVIKAVNNLLKREFRGGSVTLRQDDIIAEIQRLDDSIGRQKIFNEKWLDFEALFEKAGWEVNYDKPGYNESYPASFDFKPIEE